MSVFPARAGMNRPASVTDASTRSGHVFPARAGMNRPDSDTCSSSTPHSVPRAGGDEPTQLPEPRVVGKTSCSPRGRG